MWVDVFGQKLIILMTMYESLTMWLNRRRQIKNMYADGDVIKIEEVS